MKQNRRNVLKLGLSGAVAGWTGGLAGSASAQGAITAASGISRRRPSRATRGSRRSPHW